MQYSRCKCGEYESWHSGWPDLPCRICLKCGSTLSTHPEYHKEPGPHKYEWRYDQRTGKPDHLTCVHCHDFHKPDKIEDPLPDPSEWDRRELDLIALE